MYQIEALVLEIARTIRFCLGKLEFHGKFDILLEKRLSDVAGLKYTFYMENPESRRFAKPIVRGNTMLHRPVLCFLALMITLCTTQLLAEERDGLDSVIRNDWLRQTEVKSKPKSKPIEDDAAGGCDDIPENGQSLKVLSWNILDSFNYGKAIKRGIRWIKKQDADVLAIQESGNTTESLKKLAAQWGHDYSVNLKKNGCPVALTSKQPIEVIEKRVKGFHHGYLHCKTYGIHFFVVHFWPSKTYEAALVLDKIKPLLASGEKVIVLGDFNNRSRRDSMLKSQGKGFKITDAFEAGGFVDTTCKHGKNALYSFGSPVLIPRWAKTMEDVQAKRRRIDFIFANEALSRYSVSGTILHSNELDMMSDHYPVQVIFKFK